MGYVAVHDNVVFLYDRDSADLLILAILLILHLLLRPAVVLLSLNYVPTKHLRVLNLNLGVVEYVVVIVNVLDDLDWLLPIALLLWLRRPTPSLVGTLHVRVAGIHSLTMSQYVVFSKVIRIWSSIVRGALVALVTHEVPVPIVLASWLLLLLLLGCKCSSFGILLICVLFCIAAFVLLINYFA